MPVLFYDCNKLIKSKLEDENEKTSSGKFSKFMWWKISKQGNKKHITKINTKIALFFTFLYESNFLLGHFYFKHNLKNP